MIFVDVDDTLYSKRTRHVPDSARKALQEAQKNGHKIFVNTGRPLAYFEQEILDIGFDGMICSNGVYILIEGSLVYHKTVPKMSRKPLWTPASAIIFSEPWKGKSAPIFGIMMWISIRTMVL